MGGDEPGLQEFRRPVALLGRGIAFGISVKNVGAPEEVEPTKSRPVGYTHYTHNYKRVSEEWSLETLATHRFQPFATLVGILFLPGDALADRPNVPSFHAAVTKFSEFAGRQDERDYPELLEAIYIGLYVNNGPHLGFVRFWDVSVPLPTSGPVLRDFLTFEDLAARWEGMIKRRYKRIPLP